jgi:DNA modification methylase
VVEEVGAVRVGAMVRVGLGMASIGFDLSEDFCTTTSRRVEEFQLTGDSKINVISPKIFNKDSRRLSTSVDANSVDLVVTSPPYWDILNMKRTADGKIIRNYSDDISDLGNIADYDAFLADLKLVFTEVHEVLKPGARCISVVMDIRKKDKFFPLHEDQTRIMKEIGFELDEYVVWDRQRDYNNMKTLGYPYVYRFNRVHEFICIYQKKKAEPVKKVVKKKAATISKVSKGKIVKDSVANKVAVIKAL